MTFLPKKRWLRKPSEEKPKARVTYRPPEGPVEFGKPEAKPEMPAKAPEPKKPLEVWKILPLKHKILSVIVAVVTVVILVPVIVFVIVPTLESGISTVMEERPFGSPSEKQYLPPSKTVTPKPTSPTTKPTLKPGGLTPARDLTGTWRNPISGQGLILDSTVTGPKEEAEFSGHFDVEWNITQSGNTVSGPVTLKFVKESGRFAGSNADVTAGYKQMSGTYFWTGTVEGTGLTIDFSWGVSDPPKPLKCTFTADIMTCTLYTSPAEEEAWYAKQPCPYVDIPCPIPVNLGHRAKLSLSRVW